MGPRDIDKICGTWSEKVGVMIRYARGVWRAAVRVGSCCARVEYCRVMLHLCRTYEYRGKKLLSSSRCRMKARTVVGVGKKRLYAYPDVSYEKEGAGEVKHMNVLHGYSQYRTRLSFGIHHCATGSSCRYSVWQYFFVVVVFT